MVNLTIKNCLIIAWYVFEKEGEFVEVFGSFAQLCNLLYFHVDELLLSISSTEIEENDDM